VRLRQKACAEDAKLQIAELRGDFPGARAGRNCRIQFAEEGVRRCHERTCAALLAVIVQAFG